MSTGRVWLLAGTWCNAKSSYWSKFKHLTMPINTIDLTEKKFDNYLRQASTTNWILCVGAGICKGILPDWFDLTLNLTNLTYNKKWSRKKFKKISDEVGFSLDSWIQGCYNKLLSQGKTVEDFNSMLENALYHDLLVEADKKGIKEALIEFFESPKKLKKKKLLQLYDFFEQNYSSTSLIQIVKAFVFKESKAKLPSAIITFNADSLLHSLIILYNIKKQYDSTGHFRSPKESFRKVTRTFQAWGESIPIFHLHGSLSPANSKEKNRDSRDSLIFLESSYSNVASNMYSWAQTNFLYSAQNYKMVFLGLSMSDPNIRRWLSWTNQTYIEELSAEKNEKTQSLPHLWIKTKASDNEIQDFMDLSLRHMGVKIGLINSWSEIEETLKKIM
jgi:hypothetical protein